MCTHPSTAGCNAFHDKQEGPSDSALPQANVCWRALIIKCVVSAHLLAGGFCLCLVHHRVDASMMMHQEWAELKASLICSKAVMG